MVIEYEDVLGNGESKRLIFFSTAYLITCSLGTLIWVEEWPLSRGLFQMRSRRNVLVVGAQMSEISFHEF